MHCIFRSLSLLLILAQWIAAFAAYPLMPRQFDANLFGQMYAFGQPVSLNPRMADKACIFALPAGIFAIHICLWFFPRAFRHSFVIFLFTGLYAYAQCLVVSSAYDGPTDLIGYYIFVDWLGLIVLTPMIPPSYEFARFLFRCLAANWMMIRGRPLGQMLDVPSRSVSASINERIWIERHPIIASVLALATLFVFVLCLTIGLPISFVAAFTLASAISIAPDLRSWTRGSATPTATNAHAHGVQW